MGVRQCDMQACFGFAGDEVVFRTVMTAARTRGPR